MRSIKTVLKISLFVLSSLLFITPAFAIEYGGIGGRPAYPKAENPRTESIFIYENAPGSVVKDGIVVVNNTAETKTILVYATDTTPSSGGGFACKQYSEEVTEEGKWFTLEKSEVTLKSGKTEIVPFTVSIPSDVAVGEHNACVVVQEKKENTTKSGISLNVRAAIRAMIVIPGDMVRQLSIDSFSYVKSENGKNLLNLIIANEGNVSIDADLNIIVKNFLTQKLFAEINGEYSITHDNKQEFNFDLEDRPWGGIYRAVLGVKYDGDTGEEVLQSKILFAIVPSIYVLGLYIIILISFVTTLYLIIASALRRKWAIKNAKEYIVKTGDTLLSIANKRDMGWRFLAKMNKIKAPYSIAKGDKLLVPPLPEKKEKGKKKEGKSKEKKETPKDKD